MGSVWLWSVTGLGPGEQSNFSVSPSLEKSSLKGHFQWIGIVRKLKFGDREIQTYTRNLVSFIPPTLTWNLTTYFFSPIKKLFFLNFLSYIISDKSEFSVVKLSNTKTSFSTTSMHILCHVTDMWAKVVGSTITWGPIRFFLLVLVVYVKTNRGTCSIYLPLLWIVSGYKDCRV